MLDAADPNTNRDTAAHLLSHPCCLPLLQVAEVLNAADPNADCDTVARALAQAAAQLGSTDDITLVVMRLSPSA